MLLVLRDPQVAPKRGGTNTKYTFLPYVTHLIYSDREITSLTGISPLLPLLREGWGSFRCRCRLLEGPSVLLGLLWLCSCTARSSTRITSLGCPALQSDIFRPCPVWWWFALALCWSGLSPAGELSCCYSSSCYLQCPGTASIKCICAFFMPFLISWLAALYCLTPSASFFFFFNSLRLSHRSGKSAVTQGFLTGRCLPRIYGRVGEILGRVDKICWTRRRNIWTRRRRN